MDRYYIIGALLLGSAGTAGAVVVDALVSRSCSDTGEALFDCASEFRNEIKRGEKKKRGGGGVCQRSTEGQDACRRIRSRASVKCPQVPSAATLPTLHGLEASRR